jgi:hypothetical protein
MEPVTLTAATVATLFFSEAAKEGGKSLGAGAAKTMTRLITAVKSKFKASGTEGVLARAEKQPTEMNVDRVKAELAAQMEEDAGFAAELKDLLTQLEAAGVADQLMASGLKVAGKLKIGDMSQESSRGSSVKQEMLTDSEAQDIEVGNLSQKN